MVCSHTNKHGAKPVQTVAVPFCAHAENLGCFFGRTSDISACAMSEVKLPVMDPRVPNLRQTKQNKTKHSDLRRPASRFVGDSKKGQNK